MSIPRYKPRWWAVAGAAGMLALAIANLVHLLGEQEPVGRWDVVVLTVSVAGVMGWMVVTPVLAGLAIDAVVRNRRTARERAEAER